VDSPDGPIYKQVCARALQLMHKFNTEILDFEFGYYQRLDHILMRWLWHNLFRLSLNKAIAIVTGQSIKFIER
jgi:hypothetical protein